MTDYATDELKAQALKVILESAGILYGRWDDLIEVASSFFTGSISDVRNQYI